MSDSVRCLGPTAAGREKMGAPLTTDQARARPGQSRDPGHGPNSGAPVLTRVLETTEARGDRRRHSGSVLQRARASATAPVYLKLFGIEKTSICACQPHSFCSLARHPRYQSEGISCGVPARPSGSSGVPTQTSVSALG